MRYSSYETGWYIESEIDAKDWENVADSVLRYEIDSYNLLDQDKEIVEIILAAIKVGREAERKEVTRKLGSLLAGALEVLDDE